MKTTNEKFFKFVLVFGIYFLFCAAVATADDDYKGEKRFTVSKSKRFQDGRSSVVTDAVSHILNFAKELDLSTEQIGKIKAAQLDYKKKDIRLTADIKITRLDMRNELHSGTFDKKKILSKSDELGKLTARKIRLNTETIVKVFTVLTPGQVKKVWELHLMGKDGLGARMLEGS